MTADPPRPPPRTAVLLLNFGGPRTLAEVPAFLREILRDPNTIQLPAPQLVQDWIAGRIAARRSPEVARQYGEIGGASPIVAATERLAQALAAALAVPPGTAVAVTPPGTPAAVTPQSAAAAGVTPQGAAVAPRTTAAVTPQSAVVAPGTAPGATAIGFSVAATPGTAPGTAGVGALGTAGVGSAAPLPVLAAHRYLPGHTRETAARLMALGVERVVALPLYPHFSWATTGSSAEQLAQELDRAGFGGEVAAVRSYPDGAGYLDALGARLEETLARVPGPPGGPERVILCSAHGLPASYVARGDPYRFELYRSLDALRRRFPRERFVLSFQSRVGPAEWLRPYTDQILGDLAAQGVRQLVFLPLAFVNDHLETLYEIGHTYFGAARTLGMTPHLVPAIESHPAFVAALAGQVRDALEGRGAVPLAELLPPDQRGRRVGWWLWSGWLAAFAAALANALGR